MAWKDNCNKIIEALHDLVGAIQQQACCHTQPPIVDSGQCQPKDIE